MPSFGEELRKQRELREITLQEIAATTKVNVRFLEALERDDFDALPGGLFTRGFIRAYAVHVGLDPEAMVNAYLYEIGQARTEDRSRPHHDADQPRLQRQRPAARPSSPAGWGMAAIAVLALVVTVWLVLRTGADDPRGTRAASEAPPPSAQARATATAPQLEIAALRAVNLRVACGSVDLLERRLEKDEHLRFRCDGTFHLHTPRADSLLVRWNGREVTPPDSPLRGWNPAEDAP